MAKFAHRDVSNNASLFPGRRNSLDYWDAITLSSARCCRGSSPLLFVAQKATRQELRYAIRGLDLLIHCVIRRVTGLGRTHVRIRTWHQMQNACQPWLHNRTKGLCNKNKIRNVQTIWIASQRANLKSACRRGISRRRLSSDSDICVTKWKRPCLLTAYLNTAQRVKSCL